MKTFVQDTLLLLSLIVLFLVHGTAQAETAELAAYLPSATDVPGWEMLEEPQRYAGEELFSYIDGAAEIYYEYGFHQVIACEYVNAAEKSILVDVYEMEDAESAYGIYSLTKGPDGQLTEFGDEGTFQDSYLLFWKGSFFITITGLDSGEDVDDGILAIAGSIDQRITSAGSPPDLLRLMDHEAVDPASLIYIQGFLGLMNNYAFHADDIFGLKEGLIGNWGESTVFLLKYSDAKESQTWYANALSVLRDDELYENFISDDQNFSVTDSFQQLVYCERVQQYIVIVIGAESIDAAKSIVNTLHTE